MHKTLIDTHKESNINILKARDYYFDKARIYNNKMRKTCLFGPIIVSVIGMFLVGILNKFWPTTFSIWLENNIDIIVGCVAVLAFAIDFFLKKKIGDFLTKSNALRELYDVKVLGIQSNDFYYHFTEKEINDFVQKAKYVRNEKKYDVWYREIFSGNKFTNAICMMLDNIIYTYYVYQENQIIQLFKLIAILFLFVCYCIFYAIGLDVFVIVNPFILFLAIFDYLKDAVDEYYVSKELTQRNKELKDSIVKNAEELLKRKDQEMILRCIQDVVIDNREKGLFISKRVRDKHLSNDSEFYKELDVAKNIFWGKEVTMPEKAKDFEISTIEDENQTIDFEMVHGELVSMLEDVKACLDKHKISFMLDGGTLIGTCRKANNNGFLEWDDDIDISVKHTDVDKIIQVLQDELGHKYVIQDCQSEKYYSPRLSRFRIRQKNDRSMVAEKDSVLFELYENRGLFLDVYAYSPILVNRIVDVVFRFLMIHLINIRIRKVELDWKHGKNEKKALKKFEKLKKRYIKRVTWYGKHAKNQKVLSYEPYYIDNLKKAGPYILAKDIYGEKQYGIFEGKTYEIPSNSETVLSAFYGKDWEKSPYIPLQDLIEGDKVQFSKAKFDASNYKHLKKASIYSQKAE